ncbi:Kynurenine formamidase 2 [Colletotrichum chrysophilum]|uniref:Kynurenine formamidase n=1 Tax=Colletotrichum chrysophilum TaxID=1836956 RepID=A0AAD9EP85_9PEZI|nr:Kynurenine formamidase 2 [Colletotrichum chrysophilum]
MASSNNTQWQLTEVKSPNLDQPVPVVAALNLPYVNNGHRFQTLNIYLPKTNQTNNLLGQPVANLPTYSPANGIPCWQVHIHGGAWRDPELTSTSIEPAAAHAFARSDTKHPITAIISMNYTLSPFPTHPTLPYDPTKGDSSDPSRDGHHPDHIRDVLQGFAFLRTLGLYDDSYILSGHSAGACLAFQSTLRAPQAWGLDAAMEPPRPVAVVGMNGLYDLPGLVHDLGSSHASLKDVYQGFQSITFGPDQAKWEAPSPSHVPVDELEQRVKSGKAPRLIMIDQSAEDQLVPTNQADRLEAHLNGIAGLRVVRGTQCEGRHAAPWEEGYMVWNSVQDILKHLG